MLVRRGVRSLLVVLAVGLVIAIGVGPGSQRGAMAAAHVLHVVVLGDSGASGKGDPTGLAWGGRYGRLLHKKLGVEVVVTNLAREGKSSSVLLEELRSDPATRAAVKAADVILFGSTAGASLNEADARLEAKKCKGEGCYASALRAWARDYSRIVSAASDLRVKRKTVFRGVTEPNVVPGAQDVIPPFATVKLGLYQARLIQHTVCATMNAHGARCIHVLAAFNGPSGTRDAYASGLMNKVDCCYPSGKGQELIAELLLRTGLAPSH
jgi:hypothetical protein